MSRLAGKVAIVTGTSPNIGGGIAQGLADEGARVVCVDVAEDNARQCADWIAKRGGTSLGIACDVTDEGQVEAMVGRVRDAYGGVDILVNNAGILGGLSVLEMPLDRWSRQIAVNLTGTFLCTKHVARLMVAQGRGGSIIVIISTAGHQGQAGNIAYSTTKRGVAWGRPRPEPRARGLDFVKMLPMGKLPSPRHYARACVFLASDEAEMITGADLRVDAGAIAKYWPWVPHS